MSEAYFRVESGALGPEENFLSLDDILMSHEKLPVRTETAMPRLGAFLLERSGGAETDHAIPQVSLAARHPPERLQFPGGRAATSQGAALPGICRAAAVRGSGPPRARPVSERSPSEWNRVGPTWPGRCFHF